MAMSNFRSATLDRTFDTIYFAQGLRLVGGADTAAGIAFALGRAGRDVSRNEMSLAFDVTCRDTATAPSLNDRIVFLSYRGGKADLYSMNPDGSDVRRLTHDAGRWVDRPGATDTVVSSNWGPKWSPDGLFIAYIHLDEWEHYSIRLMDADGTFIRTITDEFRPAWSLSWSPDGTQIAFSALVKGSGTTLAKPPPKNNSAVSWAVAPS